MLGLDFAERITSLLVQKNIQQKDFVKDIGIAPNSFTKWRNGQIPNADIVEHIATYLNVTTDYLISGKSDLSPELSQLIADYQSLDVKYQNLIKTNIELLK